MKNNLKKIIDKRNIDINKVADDTGIGRTTLYSIIRGASIPSVKYALILAEYFNVAVEEIFYLDERSN